MLAALAAAPLSAYETVPYYKASLAGGQHFFETSAGSLSGNASLTAAASMKFSPIFTLIPMYSGRYQGSKQVADLAGGGTLFQALMDHKASIKGVYSAGPGLTIKPELAFKREYLKETRDEAWGDGLFDYTRPGASIEAEYLYSDPFTLRAGYDLYNLRFHNYTSLESQIGAADGSLARELAGDHVLNSLNGNFYAAANGKMPWDSIGDLTVSYTGRTYGKQRVVDEAGQLAAKTRKDSVAAAGFGWRFPGKLSGGRLLVPGLSLSYAANRSNQNNYDTQNTKFIKNYYGYARAGAGLFVSLRAPLEGGKRFWETRLGADWTRTDYDKRLVQDATGLYKTGKVYISAITSSADLSYGIAKNFKLNASMQYGRQSSNMKYEKLYRYTFSMFSYLLGFSYEY